VLGRDEVRLQRRVGAAVFRRGVRRVGEGPQLGVQQAVHPGEGQSVQRPEVPAAGLLQHLVATVEAHPEAERGALLLVPAEPGRHLPQLLHPLERFQRSQLRFGGLQRLDPLHRRPGLRLESPVPEEGDRGQDQEGHHGQGGPPQGQSSQQVHGGAPGRDGPGHRVAEDHVPEDPFVEEPLGHPPRPGRGGGGGLLEPLQVLQPEHPGGIHAAPRAGRRRGHRGRRLHRHRPDTNEPEAPQEGAHGPLPRTTQFHQEAGGQPGDLPDLPGELVRRAGGLAAPGKDGETFLGQPPDQRVEGGRHPPPLPLGVGSGVRAGLDRERRPHEIPYLVAAQRLHELGEVGDPVGLREEHVDGEPDPQLGGQVRQAVPQGPGRRRKRLTGPRHLEALAAHADHGLPGGLPSTPEDGTQAPRLQETPQLLPPGRIVQEGPTGPHPHGLPGIPQVHHGGGGHQVAAVHLPGQQLGVQPGVGQQRRLGSLPGPDDQRHRQGVEPSPPPAPGQLRQLCAGCPEGHHQGVIAPEFGFRRTRQEETGQEEGGNQEQEPEPTPENPPSPALQAEPAGEEPDEECGQERADPDGQPDLRGTRHERTGRISPPGRGGDSFPSPGGPGRPGTAAPSPRGSRPPPR
jgi:hypothetical protein